MIIFFFLKIFKPKVLLTSFKLIFLFQKVTSLKCCESSVNQNFEHFMQIKMTLVEISETF